MKRALIYLSIITTFFWTTAISLVFLTTPFQNDGQANNGLVFAFIAVVFFGLTLTFSLILSIIKSFSPDQKLPHLLIRDSIVQSILPTLGIIGLLVLQLLRAATLLNIGLWLTIIIGLIWVMRAAKNAQPENPGPTSKHRQVKPITLRRK